MSEREIPCKNSECPYRAHGFVDPEEVQLIKLELMFIFGFNEDECANPATPIPNNIRYRRLLAIKLFEDDIADLDMINSCPGWSRLADVLTDIKTFGMSTYKRSEHGKS